MDGLGDWRAESFRVYRAGRLALDAAGPHRDRLEYWVVELTEALLDLKQAVAEDDEARAQRHKDEVMLLSSELLDRLQ